MRRFMCVMLAPWLLAAALSPEALDSLRRDFQARKYTEILGPLVDHRLSLENQGGSVAEELDYMVATTFCAMDAHRRDGCDYAVQLDPTLWTGPQGRRSTADLFSDCCKQVGMLPPCAPGVGGKADEGSAQPACARVDGKFDAPGETAGRSVRQILKDVQGGSPRRGKAFIQKARPQRHP